MQLVRRYLFAILVLSVIPQTAVRAETLHALAMHDTPRYDGNFQHVDYVNPAAPKGGTLRRAETGTFDNLNPFLITGRITTGLQEALLLTYDTLMARAWNEPFTMYGMVASSVEVPPERNWIEFNLDPAARFHDGHPITSADVAFSHKILLQHGRPNQRRIYKLVTKVIVENPHKIRFELGEGHDRETVMILANMPVLPKHYWANRDFGKTTLEAPLSSGPYTIKTVDVGKRVIFERVKDYWAADKPFNRGLYNFDRLQYDFFRDDTIALQALAAGQIDLRREWSAVSWRRDYGFKAVKDGRLVMETFDNGRPARARFMVYNMRRPYFKDRKVREALAYAFDFEWLNKNLFYGTQYRLNSLFMNSELADISKERFLPPKTTGKNGLRGNLRKAIALLKEAGWELRNARMVSVATGDPFRFEILLNDPGDEKIALEFTRALKRIGIEARVRTVDTAQYIGRLSQFDFDMTPNFWRNSLSPGTEQAVYWGSVSAGTEGSFNYSGLKSPLVDTLITRLTAARTRSELVETTRKLDHAIMKEWIGVPLYDAPQDRVAFRPEIKHPQITALYGPVIESWWYDEKKSAKEDSNDSAAQ